MHYEKFIYNKNDLSLIPFSGDKSISAVIRKFVEDGWTAVTKDKSLSAQFEHTVGVTNDGFEIFTKSKKNYEQPPYLI